MSRAKDDKIVEESQKFFAIVKTSGIWATVVLTTALVFYAVVYDKELRNNVVSFKKATPSEAQSRKQPLRKAVKHTLRLRPGEPVGIYLDTRGKNISIVSNKLTAVKPPHQEGFVDGPNVKIRIPRLNPGKYWFRLIGSEPGKVTITLTPHA